MSNDYKPDTPLENGVHVGTVTSIPCPQCGLAVAVTLDSCPVDGTPTREIAIDADALERYKLLSPIGQGGMSVVYKAQHLLMDKFVAVKLLHSHARTSGSDVKRFQQEAKAASLLRHPNITPVHDFGVLPNGTSFLVMEYEPGENLAAYISHQGPLAAKEALPLFTGIAQALAHAHKQGVLHRDLKPGNVMVHKNEEGNLEGRLVDFGIAKVISDNGDHSSGKPQLTATGEIFGSPAYMSPEQCQGHQLDQRSDLYSMGCLMYEVLSGKLPHPGDTSFDIIFKRLNSEAPPLPVPAHSDRLTDGFSRIIEKCLQRDAGDRYGSAGELLDDLRALSDGREVSAATGGATRGQSQQTDQSPKPLSPAMYKLVCCALALIGIAALAVICWHVYAGHNSPQQQNLNAASTSPTASEALLPAKTGMVFPSNQAKFAPKGYDDSKIKEVFKDSTDYGEINLSDTRVTDASMDAIRGNVRLHTLILNKTDIGDDGLVLLKHFPKINQLDMVGMNKITDAGMASVAKQTSLRTIHINNSPITDAGLDRLSTIPNLESMGMSYSRVTGKGFVNFLKHQPEMQRFSCGGVGLTDKDIQALPVMPKMSLFKVQNSSLTDAAIPAIVKAFPNLEHLDIAGNDITTRGLAPLAKLSKLKIVDCGSCPDVDQKKASRLLSESTVPRRKISITRKVE